VHQVDGFSAQALDVEEAEEAFRDAFHDLAVLGHLSGLEVLFDLPGQAAPDPRDFLEAPFPGDGLHVLGQVLEGPGRLPVGDDFEARFALDLEGVGDPVEQIGDLAVLHGSPLSSRLVQGRPGFNLRPSEVVPPHLCMSPFLSASRRTGTHTDRTRPA
jgi:hypothetical protein